MSRLNEFKLVARTMSDSGMDEPTAAKFAIKYAENAYPKSFDYRKWCLQNIKIFYLEAEAQREIMQS